MKEGKNSLDFDFYFVSTPIGNMRDISNRALDILKSVDLVLCEDTRHTLKIFNKYAINTKMDSFHKHNYFFKIDNIIKKILEGKKMALVTDAGTPSISDPGKEIVEKLKSNNIKYTHIPGASAFLSAYVLSGFDTPFTFIGFLPDKNREKKQVLDDIINYNTTLIFYLSPHSLNSDLELLIKYFGEREVVLAKELTKLNEKLLFNKLKNIEVDISKGEYVLVINKPQEEQDELLSLSIEEHYQYFINLGIDKKEAIKKVAHSRKLKKQEVYLKIVEYTKED